MHRFKKEQEVFEIGNVKIGGQPGQLPTVMVGSIFYHGDKLVKDEKKGIFDEDGAEKLLKSEEEMSEKTGNPRMIDVVGESPEALITYIDFIAEVTDSPFLIDGPTADVSIPALEHVAEIGLNDRAIYNSIDPRIKSKEMEAIKEAEVSSAVMLAFNSTNPTIEGRMEAIENLMEIAQEVGIEKPLIDTTVIDIPDPGPAPERYFWRRNAMGFQRAAGRTTPLISGTIERISTRKLTAPA